MSSSLENSEVIFHTSKNALYHSNPSNIKFGIVRLKTEKKAFEQPFRNIVIVFSIDCSLSMTDSCNNDKRKIDYAKHTLIGMLTHLAEEYENHKSNTMIKIAVLTFSENTKIIVDFEPISLEALPHIFEKVNKIEPEDNTNIENALIVANQVLLQETTKTPPENTKMYHIQLTDGQVTSGEHDYDKLAQLVNPNYNHTFVGFGDLHDDYLLYKLCENPRNDYRFIDKIEYASIVFGEILHGILYHNYDSVKIQMDSSTEIYNWKTNQWEDHLVVHNLSYDSERIFQIRALGQDTEIEVSLFEVYTRGESLNIKGQSPEMFENTEEKYITTLYSYPNLMDTETDEIQTEDLTVYSFRQKSQEILYEIREFIKKNNHKKMYRTPDHMVVEKCCDFLENIKKYMKDHHLTENRTLRLLHDDIHIACKTLHSKNAHMWCTNRQQSSGKQHSYQPTQFEDTTVNDYSSLNPTCRYSCQRRKKRNIFDPDADTDTDTILSNPGSANTSQNSINGQHFNQTDEDDARGQMSSNTVYYNDLSNVRDAQYDDDPFELTQNYDMNVMSPSMVRTVRAISRDTRER